MRFTIRLKKYICAICVLCVFAGAMAQQSTRRIVEHEVRQSETVYSLASRYDTTVEKIYELNPWARTVIKEGDKLLILRGDKALSALSNTGDARQHTIAAGETLYRIARLYGTTEEAITTANPGITAENFPIGITLRIPAGQNNLTIKSSDTRAVRVLLMLPLVKTPRYLEFYRGFLMGMYDLKKDGISIRLTVLDAEGDAEVEGYIASGQLQQGYDLVIGGVTEAQVQMLARATKSGHYVVPFSVVQAVESPRLIRLNQSPKEVVARVVPRFMRQYEGKTVYFVHSDQVREDLFAQELKRALSAAGASFRTVDVQTNLSTLDTNSIVVPASSDRKTAEQVITALGASTATLFGYPQWQSYGTQFVRSMHQRNTTIYSTFFFDISSNEGKQFLTDFRGWYNRRLVNSFPKFGVLGYDIARYFIRANALLGNSFVSQGNILSGDGLQIDITLDKQGDTGYVNRSCYFITFSPDGSVARVAI